MCLVNISRFHSVAVSTSDFESGTPSSNLGGTFFCSDSVVVITSALHAEGQGFKPLLEHIYIAYNALVV